MYGLDLDDLYRGTLAPLRAADLAMELPYGSRVWIALDADSSWTTADYLMAEQADQLAWANWQRGGGKGNKPKPIPRPADSRKKAETDERTQAMAAAFLARQEQRQQLSE